VTTPGRAEAAAALMVALRDVADANERLQLAVSWVFDAFGDHLDAETVRMLPVRGGPERPGRPPVPIVNREQESRGRLYAHPSVTGDETGQEAPPRVRLGQPLTDAEAELYGPEPRDYEK
jgi:hypothetical protein